MTNSTQLARITPAKKAVPASGTGKSVRQSPGLTRRQKAAIMVRFLLSEGADLDFSDLPEELQAELTRQMGDMRLVDRQTLANVVAEFAGQLEEIGVTFPHDLAGALTILDGRIHPRTAARLRKQAGVRQYADPWDRIRALDAPALLPIFQDESTEIAAVVLSKLDVTRAAEVLALLPGDHARRITYAVSLTGAVTPDAVDRIGLSLAAQMDAQPERAFADGPDKRVGAILNFSPSATRDELLTALEDEDAEFAARVRRAIFTFNDIPARIASLDVPKLTRAVDQPVLVMALAHATATDGTAAADHILSNLSGRMADALREEMAESGIIKPKSGEEAMGAVVAAIRQLESAGEIELIPEEEDQ
ncbi:flagellar motor switch protein FliG [Thalassovita litoralis]|uniref:Flagellar motor switch protein FliG n=1 Tax=Thalassovita litoralis TaxID=1010611 RepID=A0A521DXU8_9RHOB|nr:FliG C-terminal domain-containing protein [Thalassovita litoralis]SMO76549.1 flagellar motor switch protein FliG [Thalassovita litoralis]